MEKTTIQHRITLLVRLIDTSTGAVVEELGARFFTDEGPLNLLYRGNGNYVFLNGEQKDGKLTVMLRGFEPCTLDICYEKLDKKLPIADAFLIPSENAKGIPVATFSGRLPGLEQIQAVRLGFFPCFIDDFDERRRIMKLMNTHQIVLDDADYGLVHPDRETYEPFTVVKTVSESSVKLKEALREPFEKNDPVARIVFGMVSPDGAYVLRVRDDATDLVYMVRYTVQGKESFKTVDMHRKDVLLE